MCAALFCTTATVSPKREFFLKIADLETLKRRLYPANGDILPQYNRIVDHISRCNILENLAEKRVTLLDFVNKIEGHCECAGPSDIGIEAYNFHLDLRITLFNVLVDNDMRDRVLQEMLSQRSAADWIEPDQYCPGWSSRRS